jgi:response regulator RpfG family c-di-GMP phosphodiesterase
VQIEAIQDYQTVNEPDLRKLKVMIVDDEPMICETLKIFFHSMGINSIKTVNSGEMALSAIEGARYDYIFMDLMMPGISGIDTLKKIKEIHQYTSVIIMTGYPSMDTVINAMRNGASDFLIKPFRLQDIKIILERIHRFQILMEKNWLLHQELEGKKQVEKLNTELEKMIAHQSRMYDIVDSLSRISKSEDLYKFIVTKSIDSCNAGKACFMLFEHGEPELLVLSQQGMQDIYPGYRICINSNSNGKLFLGGSFLEKHFSKSIEEGLNISNYGTKIDNNIIAIPFHIRNEPFGLLIIGNKNGGKLFNDEDKFILMFLAERTALNIENIALYNNLTQSLMASLTSLVSAIEAKDSYTQQHSSRVTEYSKKIALRMGCSYDDIHRLESSGPIHDIGKIGVHDSILNKPGLLTSEEFEEIKNHPLIGLNIVAPLGLDPDEQAIIRNHHERWDGKGYPDGLSGENIPRLSRILSVADSFDAMNSNRAYRKSLPFSVCIRELRTNSGTQFDPDVVDAAVSIFNSDPEISDYPI